MGTRDTPVQWWPRRWWAAVQDRLRIGARADRPSPQNIPGAVLRGVVKLDHCCRLEDGQHRFKSDAFKPDERTSATRADKCQELSVNYEDDTGALGEIKGRQHMNAIARVSVEDIEHIKERGYLAGIERSATEENPYHGDILFPNAPAWQTRLAQSALAVNATRADE